MADIARMEIGGLICDNTSCDWKDMSIKVEDYAQYIGTGCPKCGECVLTQRDYNVVQTMLKVTGLISRVGRFFGVSVKEEDLVTVEMNTDGKGNITMDNKKPFDYVKNGGKN